MLGLAERFLRLEVHKAARIFPVFKEMYHRVSRPLALIAGVIAAGGSRPPVFQRPRRGDLLLREHTGDFSRPVPRKAKAVNLPHDGGGFLVDNEIFVLIHEVVIHRLARDELAAHALGVFYRFDFLARIPHQPFIKNIPQRAKSFSPSAPFTPSLIAIKRTPFCGKIISVYIPACK